MRDLATEFERKFLDGNETEDDDNSQYIYGITFSEAQKIKEWLKAIPMQLPVGRILVGSEKIQIEFPLDDCNKVDGVTIYKGIEQDQYPIKIDLTKAEMLELYRQLDEKIRNDN